MRDRSLLKPTQAASGPLFYPAAEQYLQACAPTITTQMISRPDTHYENFTMRINVTGNAGSGKSTLAKIMADELDLPLIEMDRIIWASGWQRMPKEICQAKLASQLQQESWVLDGVSRVARSQADLIVFLDFPRRVCVWRCAKRNGRYLFKSRSGLPEGCPEWKVIPALAKIIRDFPSHARIAILRDIAELNVDSVVIKNSVDLTEFSANIASFSHQPISIDSTLII